MPYDWPYSHYVVSSSPTGLSLIVECITGLSFPGVSLILAPIPLVDWVTTLIDPIHWRATSSHYVSSYPFGRVSFMAHLLAVYASLTLRSRGASSSP